VDDYQTLVQIIALTLGAAWASGINLYATVAVLGLASNSGYAELPATLAVVEDPLVILAAGFMYCVEFFVDKTPGVDSAWDALHTFIRIPAGAMLAAGAIGEVSPAVVVAAGLVGGTVSAAAHTAKAGSRALINTSPEPFTNWTASVAEDLAVFAGLWAALNHPAIFLVILTIMLLLAIWLLPRLFRAVGAVLSRLRSLFRSRAA
jgi:hypothetical protein